MYWTRQVTDRNSVGFKEMVELDLTYIKNRSLGLDIKLILKTVLVLFGSKNAFDSILLYFVIQNRVYLKSLWRML